jgi:hypothetical protein
MPHVCASQPVPSGVNADRASEVERGECEGPGLRYNPDAARGMGCRSGDWLPLRRLSGDDPASRWPCGWRT